MVQSNYVMGDNSMVRKNNKIVALILIVLTIIPFVFAFFENKSKYLYSKFVFDTKALLVVLVSIVVANIVLLGIMFLCKNNSVLKAIFLLPITLITLWIMFVVSGLSMGNFWKSETKDFELFSEVDFYLENGMTVAGLSLGEITDAEIYNVEGFEYSYSSKILFSTFSFKGHFTFSQKSYNEIKNAFLSSSEFHEIRQNEYDPAGNEMTGHFEIDSSIIKYETKTYVDEWERLTIYFNDERCSFYFDLKGGCKI